MSLEIYRGEIISRAMRWNGAKYKLGREVRIDLDPVTDDDKAAGIDCSELVEYAYGIPALYAAGIKMPDGANAQYRYGLGVGKAVERAYALQTPGVLTFLRDSSLHIYHVGLMVGDGKNVFHAWSKGAVASACWTKIKKSPNGFDLFVDPLIKGGC